MDLKRKIKNVILEQKSNQKLKETEYEKSLIRSDEDWEIIDNYLSSLLLKKAMDSDISNHEIELNRYCFEFTCPTNDSGEDILLTNGQKLHITHKDIKRFCRQHHFRLQFLNRLYSNNYKKSFFYDEVYTRFYLIKV